MVPEDRNDFDRLHDFDILPQRLGAWAIDEVCHNTRSQKSRALDQTAWRLNKIFVEIVCAVWAHGAAHISDLGDEGDQVPRKNPLAKERVFSWLRG